LAVFSTGFDVAQPASTAVVVADARNARRVICHFSMILLSCMDE
jgi:hypothetical protein